MTQPSKNPQLNSFFASNARLVNRQRDVPQDMQALIEQLKAVK